MRTLDTSLSELQELTGRICGKIRAPMLSARDGIKHVGTYQGVEPDSASGETVLDAIRKLKVVKYGWKNLDGDKFSSDVEGVVCAARLGDITAADELGKRKAAFEASRQS